MQDEEELDSTFIRKMAASGCLLSKSSGLVDMNKCVHRRTFYVMTSYFPLRSFLTLLLLPSLPIAVVNVLVIPCKSLYKSSKVIELSGESG